MPIGTLEWYTWPLIQLIVPRSNRSGTSYPHLQRRGGRYYFRLKIPKDLIEDYRRSPDDPKYPGKLRREIVVPLKTGDLDEARSHAQGLAYIHGIEFRAKRKAREERELAELGVKRVPVQEVVARIENHKRRLGIKDLKTVTPAIADRIRLSVLREELDADRDERLGVSPEDPTETPEGREERIAALRRVISTGETEAFHQSAIITAETYGFRVRRDTEGLPLLAYSIVEGLLRADEFIKQRDAGVAVDAEAVAPMAKTALREMRTSGTQFDELIELWISKKKDGRPAKTVASYKADMRAFATFLHERGKDWVEEVTNDDWRDYVDHVEKTQHPKTALRKVTSVRTVFSYAAEKRKLQTDNPCTRVSIAGVDAAEKPRLPFTLEHLKTIFNSPVYLEGFRPRGRGGEAFYWLPLLACFSGAREEELGQLRVEDVRKEYGLGWCIRISDEHPEQHVKTPGSRRSFPLHPELERCGFLEYVELQRSKGCAWLFEELKPDKYGTRTASFSKLFNRYLRSKLMITDRHRTFHSFRHSFKDACRDARVPLVEHDAITGHRSKDDASSGYGGEQYPLKPLFIAMRKVKYRGLNLEHLYRTTPSPTVSQRSRAPAKE